MQLVIYFLSLPSPPRLSKFRSSVVRAFSSEHAQSLPLERLTQLVNSDHHDNPFAPSEVGGALDRMQEANQVMVSEGVVFLI